MSDRLPAIAVVPLIFSEGAFLLDPAGFGTWSQAFAWRLPWFHWASPSTTLDKMPCGIVARSRCVKKKIPPISNLAGSNSAGECDVVLVLWISPISRIMNFHVVLHR